ncbi:hypothetical protein Goari_017777, partial [Gossypium aridum]|nr:hypothetical protein [Gossypium aridum]
ENAEVYPGELSIYEFESYSALLNFEKGVFFRSFSWKNQFLGDKIEGEGNQDCCWSVIHSPEKLRKPFGSETGEGNSYRLSPIQITKTSDLAPVTPRIVPKKQNSVVITEGMQPSKPHKLESIDSLTKKVDSGLSLSGGSPEDSREQEKKASEHGINSASDKSSDGATGLAKTSGSAKVGDHPDYNESGKSSICRGSTSSDVSDE